jgi:hypothetical protein
MGLTFGCQRDRHHRQKDRGPGREEGMLSIEAHAAPRETFFDIRRLRLCAAPARRQ